MNIWQRRIIRFWLAVLLPIALVFAYFGYGGHKEAVFWQEQVSHWYRVVYRNEPSGLKATKSELQKLFDDAVQARDESIEKRKHFGIASILLVLLPVMAWLIGAVGKWVWYVERSE